METRPKDQRSATRYTAYVLELQEFFKVRGVRFGRPEDVAAFSADLAVAGSLHDEMMSMARAIIFREGGMVPRNELLDLILVAVGGPLTDETGYMGEPVAALSVFVGEVMQSFKRKSFGDDEPAEEEDLEASGEMAVEAPMLEEKPPVFVARVGREVIVEEDRPLDVVAVGRPARPVSSAYARAQLRSEAEWQESHPGEGLKMPSSPEHAPRVLDGLMVVERVPRPVDHFFRNVMLGLSVCLVAAVTWRHWNPVPVPGSPSGMVVGSATSRAVLVPSAEGGSAAANSGPVASVPLEPSQSSRLERPAGPEAGRTVGEQPAVSMAPLAPVVPASGVPVPAVGAAPPSQVVARRRTPSPRTRGGSPAGRAVDAVVSPQPGGFLVSSGMMAANLISAPAPKYPKMARMTGVEGQVILQAVVSGKGTVVATHVLDGHHMLRGAASQAVRGWRFRPYVVNGKPTDVATIVIVAFHLPR